MENEEEFGPDPKIGKRICNSSTQMLSKDMDCGHVRSMNECYQATVSERLSYVRQSVLS